LGAFSASEFDCTHGGPLQLANEKLSFTTRRSRATQRRSEECGTVTRSTNILGEEVNPGGKGGGAKPKKRRTAKSRRTLIKEDTIIARPSLRSNKSVLTST